MTDLNAVARAVDIARSLLVEYDHAARPPEHVREAVDAITEALVAAGAGRAHAEWATTRWMIHRGGEGIWACVAATDEGGPRLGQDAAHGR